VLHTASAPQPWLAYDASRRRTLLFMLFLISTSSYVDRSVMSVLLEPIKAEFGISDSALGVLTGIAFAASYAVLGLPVASLADRGDRKKLIIVSLGVWSAMTALCGLAASFWQLALARFGVGAGEAGVMPASQSLIADYFAPEERARALGVFMMSSVAGAILGLGVGGAVAGELGWRAAFLICGFAGLPLLLLAPRILHEPRRDSEASSRIAAEPLFVAVRSLLARRTYVDLFVAFVLFSMVSQGALAFTVSLIVRLHGYTLAQAGAAFGILSAISAVIGSLVGGLLADRLAARDVRWLGWLPAIAMIVAMPALMVGFAAHSANVLLAGLFLGTVLIFGMAPPLFAALHRVCGSQRRAMAVAIVFFGGSLVGLGLGPVMTGVLSDALARIHGAAEGLRYAMMVALTLLPIGGIFMLRAARSIRNDETP
jgi:MFS family permease